MILQDLKSRLLAEFAGRLDYSDLLMTQHLDETFQDLNLRLEDFPLQMGTGTLALVAGQKTYRLDAITDSGPPSTPIRLGQLLYLLEISFDTTTDGRFFLLGKNIVDFDRLVEIYTTKSVQGRPKAYTLYGQDLLFFPVPDTALTLDLRYIKQVPGLSAPPADSNLFSEHFYTLLLEGMKVRGWATFRNEEEERKALQRYEMQLSKLQNYLLARKYSGRKIIREANPR